VGSRTTWAASRRIWASKEGGDVLILLAGGREERSGQDERRGKEDGREGGTNDELSTKVPGFAGPGIRVGERLRGSSRLEEEVETCGWPLVGGRRRRDGGEEELTVELELNCGEGIRSRIEGLELRRRHKLTRGLQKGLDRKLRGKKEVSTEEGEGDRWGSDGAEEEGVHELGLEVQNQFFIQ